MIIIKSKSLIYINLILLCFFIATTITTYSLVSKSQQKLKKVEEKLNNYKDSISQQILQNSNVQLAGKTYKEEHIIYSKRIEIGAGESLILYGELMEGMKVKILESNCNHKVAILHNQKRVLIKEDQSGQWDMRINQNTNKNEILFSNEGNSPCGMRVEIYSSQNSNEQDEQKIRFLLQDIEPSTIECIFNEFKISDSWQMKMNYSDCIRNNSKIQWSELTTYFSIENFHQKDGIYKLIGNKFAENYKGEYLEYSKEFPLISDNGFMKDCQIILPISSKLGENQKSDGFIKLIDAEIIQNKIIIYGEFRINLYDCRGKVTLTSN